MKLTEASFLVFDTETTGTDIEQARIVELGAVIVRGGKIAERLHTFVHPGGPIPAEVSAIHGVTDADVADAPRFEALAPRVEERFGAFDLGGLVSRVLLDEASDRSPRPQRAARAPGHHGGAQLRARGSPLVGAGPFPPRHRSGLRGGRGRPASPQQGGRLGGRPLLQEADLMSHCAKHDEERPPIGECCEGCLNDQIRDSRELAEWSSTKAIGDWLLDLAGKAFAAGDDLRARTLRDDIAKQIFARATAMRAAYDKRKKEAK